MKNVSILPVDSYIVVNKSLLNDNDRLILTILYQPIIGSNSLSLYLTLWADLNKNIVMSSEYTHHHLMNIMNLRLEDIIDARKKLEAIGLIKSYYRKNNINNYVYELYSPLSAVEFFSNPILATSLLSIIGKKEYQELINFYKIPKVSINEYENITTNFSDMFTMSPVVNDSIEKNILKKEKNDIIIDDVIDFDFIISALPNIFNEKALTTSMRRLINKLSYLYSFDNETMCEIIKDSLNERGMISESELKKNSRNYYSFENNSEPKLIYKVRNTTQKDNTNMSIREKLIECFSSTTPYKFLMAKYKGAKPTDKDIKLIESLLVEQQMNPGVVNVLIDYVLRTNDKKLNKNYVEAIASQWKMKNINTIESAMKQAEKEFHNSYKTNKREIKNVEKLPTWYGKNVKKEEMTNDEIKELENMLSEFR